MTLPRSLEQLAGRRAARWIRESTAGQFDAFGPDAQREQQDRAIERWGLVDVGLTWQVAHSGRTVATTPAFAEMLAAAGSDFDVLVVGYVSRFARDLRTAVNARHELHAAGAVILFADERILTSDEDRWDEWAREAVEAESYSRKLGRRIREGYSAKRRRGEPGGRPPFGLGWGAGRPHRLESHPDQVPVLRQVFVLAGAGRQDRSISADLGLSIDTVRGILTNPIYVGRLRDGARAAIEPLIDLPTWQRVQDLRARRRTRGGKPETVRAYALPMLRCAGCGARLIGDSGRYRHRAPCAAFTAARRRSAFRHRLVRTQGSSYPAELYEGAIGQALEAAALSDRALVEAAAEYAATIPTSTDRLAPRRIEAERQRALSRYSRDRDVAALEARMAALDVEESAEVRTSPQPVEWREVLPWLRDLAGMWREALPTERRAIAEQLFDQVDALGCRELIVTPSPAALAHGLMAGVHTVTVVGATGSQAVTVRFRTPPRLTIPARAAG